MASEVNGRGCGVDQAMPVSARGGSGGLKSTAEGARVRVSGGQVTVRDGPFTEAKEVVGGYAQFDLKSKEEAIESAVRFMELHKKHWPGWEGETEVRQMFGPDDFP